MFNPHIVELYEKVEIGASVYVRAVRFNGRLGPVMIAIRRREPAATCSRPDAAKVKARDGPDLPSLQGCCARPRIAGSLAQWAFGGIMKPSATLLLGIAFAICFGAPASSATIKTMPGKDGRVAIQIFGQIAEGDADVFISAVKQANAAGKVVDSVQLNSTGGKLLDGARLAAVIKIAKLSTTVAQGAVCASACFLAFAAGDPKFVGYGALIGVHKASDKGGRETAASGEATLSMARFAKELGVPSAIIARMLSTPARQIAWLNPQELRSMGISDAGKSLQAGLVATDGAPVHQIPEESRSLATQTPQTRASRPSWNEFIDKAIALSAEQNGGSAIMSRLCKPEFRTCVMTVAYLLKDGRQGLAKVIKGEDGSISRREVCESNESYSQRDCTDWDTGAKYRDVKNAKGDWTQTVGN
jgi:hypothetical protein